MDQEIIQPEAFFWALQGICALYRKPFSAELARQQLAAPHTAASLAEAAEAIGFSSITRKTRPRHFTQQVFPLLAWCKLAPPDGNDSIAADAVGFTLILRVEGETLLIVQPGDAGPRSVALADFVPTYLGWATAFTPALASDADPDSVAQFPRSFGFAWFIPELLKHKRIWQEILLASLVIQLIALATPLFTQAIIDKVVVHQTHSTLFTIGFGMAVFVLFSAALGWLRQYLVLHTGNRVDAVLGSSVVRHLFRLPPRYFQQRPTGVVAARLQGVETIREFIAGAAVTLLLDLPFLLVFVGVMWWYSMLLSLVVFALLALVAMLSMAVAPMFQRCLQQQFMLGARNQAFITEYLVGIETVKSLQLEAQLHSRYGAGLAAQLAAGFSTRQLANTYNATANFLEQVMTMGVLMLGAWTVMEDPSFTIGMLVAFQMFASRLSQPVLRLVGLWQQFQQARLSVARLGDVMNMPAEVYSMLPAREAARKRDAAGRRGAVQVEAVAFRYAEHLPLVYRDVSLNIAPGQAVCIMGPSGCGKSTLAKLLQGFYEVSAGRILLDGVDLRHMAANELRAFFGVVPQETVLFSGTILDNLQMACPEANFEQIVAACKMAEIHATIEGLPQGYQSEIGERGAGLSGGQKQRIAIARALLRRPGILVFDEATSALDADTAEQFALTINALHGKVTIIFITHSLPRGLKVDAVFRLGPNGVQPLARAAGNPQNTAMEVQS